MEVVNIMYWALQNVEAVGRTADYGAAAAAYLVLWTVNCSDEPFYTVKTFTALDLNNLYLVLGTKLDTRLNEVSQIAD